ncbi:MAG: hypothetical protein CM15mV5_3080 [uncultured marine virus]|nr:MAG: hypothetical protein CM15mV5_3080 [uncultured marine virus]
MEPIVSNTKVLDLEITFEGIGYSSAPTLDIEKYYYASFNTSGDLQFKFNFKEYFRDNDSYKIRGYYNGGTQYAEVVFSMHILTLLL